MKTQYTIIGENSEYIATLNTLKDKTQIQRLFKVYHETNSDGRHSHSFGLMSVTITCGDTIYKGVIDKVMGRVKDFLEENGNEVNGERKWNLLDMASYQRSGRTILEGMAKLLKNVEHLPEPEYEPDPWR